MNRRVHLNSAAALSKQWGPPLYIHSETESSGWYPMSSSCAHALVVDIKVTSIKGRVQPKTLTDGLIITSSSIVDRTSQLGLSDSGGIVVSPICWPPLAPLAETVVASCTECLKDRVALASNFEPHNVLPAQRASPSTFPSFGKGSCSYSGLSLINCQPPSPSFITRFTNTPSSVRTAKIWPFNRRVRW